MTRFEEGDIDGSSTLDHDDRVIAASAAVCAAPPRAAIYRVRDPEARPGQKLTYVLLALGFDDSRQRCGPFTVRAGGG